MRVDVRRISVAGISTARFWQIGLLTAAGAIGATAPAEAARYYWPDYDNPSYYRPDLSFQPRRHKARRQQAKKNETAAKQTGAKPQGPLIIAVSIENQKVRVYDSNGLFAESPVSTGMRGHSTPMGVFSIIQKHKFHHSNIYSGAPMPYMQRITWSGVAMHAGVLPGYPASHGCIRMPMAFAVKMWNWTRMGARVVITPGEITPASFSHPLLVTQKVSPQPVAAEEPKVDAPLGVKTDKGADAGTPAKPATLQASIELRPTVGHAGSTAAPREQIRTADASASVSGAAETKSAETTVGEAKSTARTDTKTSEARVPTDGDAAKTEITAGIEDKPAKTEIGTDEVKAEAPKADALQASEPKPAEKPVEPARTDAPAATADGKKDPARLPGVARPELPKRTGQIAVFISRKDSKLYVRQNFSPLFNVPVTITPDDRPLGTHVFTAETDSKDANVLRWSVVSLPVSRNVARNDDDERRSRRRRMAGTPAETKPLPAPDSPAEALDRIAIPPDAMARIAEALTSGGSIIVSDQGINQGETGEGTDFIVSLR